MPVKAIQKATEALQQRFPGARITSKKIEGADRYQLLIISDLFARMRPYRRQDVVWDVIKTAVTADEILRIGFVLPVPPSEIFRDHVNSRSNTQKVLQPQ